MKRQQSRINDTRQPIESYTLREHRDNICVGLDKTLEKYRKPIQILFVPNLLWARRNGLERIIIELVDSLDIGVGANNKWEFLGRFDQSC